MTPIGRYRARPARPKRAWLTPREERIVELARTPMPPQAILAHMPPGVSINVIYIALSKARKLGLAVPRFSATPGPQPGHTRGHRGAASAPPAAAKATDDVAITVPSAVLAAFAVAATRRRMSPAMLGRALLERVAADGLVDAIMDDRED